MVANSEKKEQLDFINETVDKKKLGALLSNVYEKFGTARSAELS